MADEKLNTGQEENSQPSLFDAGPEGAPTPEPRHKRTPPSRLAGTRLPRTLPRRSPRPRRTPPSRPPGIRPPRMPPLGPPAR